MEKSQSSFELTKEQKKRLKEASAARKAQLKEIESRRKERQEANRVRDLMIRERKHKLGVGGGKRRPRATHFKLLPESGAFTKPQESSIRGRILAYLRWKCNEGEIYSINNIEKPCYRYLFNVDQHEDIRVYLFKMEEMNHLDLITQEE